MPEYQYLGAGCAHWPPATTSIAIETRADAQQADVERATPICLSRGGAARQHRELEEDQIKRTKKKSKRLGARYRRAIVSQVSRVLHHLCSAFNGHV